MGHTLLRDERTKKNRNNGRARRASIAHHKPPPNTRQPGLDKSGKTGSCRGPVHRVNHLATRCGFSLTPRGPPGILGGIWRSREVTMVTTDTASFRAPEEVIRRIGLGKLKDLADEARCGCVRKHIKEPFLTWLKKTNKTHKDLANLLGVSRAKATRLCNGYLKGMKLEDVDNYLSIVGFSIDDALP